MNKTAEHLRRDIIESGPYTSIAQAVAIEQTERSRHGLQGYQPRLDGPIWPNPLSLYWAIPPEQRPPIEGNTMTEKTKKTEPAVTEKAEPAPLDEQSREIETEGMDEWDLVTRWSPDEASDFNTEQARVHDWMQAPNEARLAALESRMTLSDAEELMAVCQDVARQHEKRAQEARSLRLILATRLSREHEAINADETKMAVPTLGIGSVLTKPADGEA